MMCSRFQDISWKKYFDILLACGVFLVFHLILQVMGGTFNNECGGHPDEAAHYVTGLMIRDYLVNMDWLAPMKFAENYYIHYPKISLGHWPPFFYIIEGFWISLFSISRHSLLVLLGIFVSLVAGTVYAVLRKELGIIVGILAGFLFIAVPVVQEYSGMIMTEVLVALLSLWATLCLGKFIKNGKWQWSVAFGMLSTLAIMTKGNALALALVPLISILLCRRLSLLKEKNFWLPVIVVFIICAPWYWFTLDMVRNGMQSGSISMEFTIAAFPRYSSYLVGTVGFGLFGFAILGFYKKIVKAWMEDTVDGMWGSIGALLVGVWIFHWIVPAGLEERHLITAVPALLMFVAAGVDLLVSHIHTVKLSIPAKRITLAAFVLIFFSFETFSLRSKSWHGFGAVADYLLSYDEYKNSVFLVSSDPRGEGMFIAEVASKEPRPSHVVLRSTKVLVNSKWDRSEYKLILSSPKEVMDYLEEIPVGIVVIDRSISEIYRDRHHDLIEETVEQYADRWEMIGQYPIFRDGVRNEDSLIIYKLLGHENRQVEKIRINMPEMLGKSIEKDFN